MKKISLLLSRLVDNGQQTIGSLQAYCIGEFSLLFSTLELPFKNNNKNTSCILPGKYTCSKRFSEKYGWHLIVNDVLGRSYILIHYGNFNTDTKGCILIGDGFAKINKDSLMDLTNSRKSLQKLMSYISDDDKIELIIQEAII